MIGEKTVIPADVIPESDIAVIMRKANELKEENETLKEKNAYLSKEIRNTRDDMNLLMRSMFNLIENKITGNNIEGLKKTRDELVNAMTDKKPKEL